MPSFNLTIELYKANRIVFGSLFGMRANVLSCYRANEGLPLTPSEGKNSPAAAWHLFGTGDDWRVEHFMWLVHVCVERSRIFAKILEG